MLEIKKINSLENPQIKLLKKLGLKKYRQEFGLFCVENLVIIFDALKSGYDFESLFFTNEFSQKNSEALKILQKKSETKNFFEIDNKINKSFSSLETPAGIVAVYKIKEGEVPERNGELEKKVGLRKKGGLKKSDASVYLNGINDPGNLGTIMRSALAFGFKTLVLDETCADIYNPKVISAAKDSIFKLNFIFDRNRAWLEREVVQNNLALYATDLKGEENLAKLKGGKNFCLALGSESRGLSEEILKLAAKKIKIEISSEIESLNVAVAAGILFYHFKAKI
ncbi:RNA methyltransferase [Patescibacteria group bacterium]|nr:RNA methyltransferase [Patescibacteria group bacterium]